MTDVTCDTISNKSFVRSVVQESVARVNLIGEEYIKAYEKFTMALIERGLPLVPGCEEQLQKRGILYHSTRTWHDLTHEEALTIAPILNSFNYTAKELDILGLIYPDKLGNPYEKFDETMLDRLATHLSNKTLVPKQENHFQGKWTQSLLMNKSEGITIS